MKSQHLLPNLLKISTRVLVVLVLTFLMPLETVAQDENLNVLDGWIDWSDGSKMLIHHLNEQAFGYLDRRDREVDSLETEWDWRQRQKQIQKRLIDLVGPFSEKTPLNPQVTGVVHKSGYRVEKVVYQSMPNFYVTGCLFVPEGRTRRLPAILYVCGHTPEGIRSHGYQKQYLNLVKKGFVVFAIDPIGQGERLQYFDSEEQRSHIGRPTDEHSYFGNQCFLAGVSPARYFTWDGIRGIDYLTTRPEVDPTRIGVTGVSGGGTQTTYIMAFDERVKAAAPGLYITSFRRLLESIGPQDAEQNFYRQVSSGLTHADFLEVRAPKPTLLYVTTRDFFSIQGARESFTEAMQTYRALGYPEYLRITEADYGHALNRKNNEALYDFFQEFLQSPGSSLEEDVEFLDQKELQVTRTGQVATSLSGETVFSLNKAAAVQLIGKLQRSRKNISQQLELVRRHARDISGYVVPGGITQPIFRGRYQRDGYGLELYALKGEGDYVTPLLVMVPHGDGPFPAVIYLHPKGKSADASPAGRIESLVRLGFLVAAPDLIGTGETAVGSDRRLYRYHHVPYIGVLIGRSIVGIQAGDLIRVSGMLRARPDVRAEDISVVALNESCPTALHAAVFDPSIRRLALSGALISYRAIVTNRFYKLGFDSAVPGALTAYDLPDLMGCVAPRKLLLIGLRDHIGKGAPSALVERDLAFPRAAYAAAGVPTNLTVDKLSSDRWIEQIGEWLLEGR